jgi:hypothetical protein
VNSTSWVKVVKSPCVVNDRVTLSLAVNNGTSRAHLIQGSKQTILNFEGNPFSGTTFPSTPSFSGSVDEDFFIRGSHVGQLRTSIHTAHTRSGGALTVTLCWNRALVPSAYRLDGSGWVGEFSMTVHLTVNNDVIGG